MRPCPYGKRLVSQSAGQRGGSCGRVDACKQKGYLLLSSRPSHYLPVWRLWTLRCFVALVLLIAFVAAPQGRALAQAPAGGAESDPTASGWTFHLSPYVFLAGVSGSLTLANTTFPINASLSEIVDNLRIGGFIAFEGNNGRWGFHTDLELISLVGNGSGQTGVEYQLDTVILQADATFYPHETLSFLAGLRAFDLDQKLTFPTQPAEEASTTVVDPVFGAVGLWDLSEHWRFAMRGDVGGFGVSSEFTFQLSMFFGWRFSQNWSLDFGYRVLGYKINVDDVQTSVRLSGLLAGVTYGF